AGSRRAGRLGNPRRVGPDHGARSVCRDARQVVWRKRLGSAAGLLEPGQLHAEGPGLHDVKAVAGQQFAVGSRLRAFRRIDILRLIVRMKRFYLITRDLHLYVGLFISPFVLLFAISVIFLVHAWIPGMSNQPASRTATG